MSLKRVHFGPDEVWTYRIGRTAVRFTAPGGRSYVVNTRVLDNNCGVLLASIILTPAVVKTYAWRKLRFTTRFFHDHATPRQMKHSLLSYFQNFREKQRYARAQV